MLGGMYFSTTSALLASCETARRHVGALVQIDLLDADAVVAGRLDAADVVDQRGDLPLVQREDAVLDVQRAHPGIGPDDADDRDVDLRKDVDRHAQRRADAEHADHDHAGGDRVRTLQNETDELHAACCLPMADLRARRV